MTGATGETEAGTRNAPVRSAAVRLHAHAPTQACSSGGKAAVVLPKLLLFLSCRIYQQITNNGGRRGPHTHNHLEFGSPKISDKNSFVLPGGRSTGRALWTDVIFPKINLSQRLRKHP